MVFGKEFGKLMFGIKVPNVYLTFGGKLMFGVKVPDVDLTFGSIVTNVFLLFG